MQDLIERLEKATGSDDGLDEDILLACGWVIEVDDDHEEMHWFDPAGVAWSRMQLPRPTHSLDAALTLVGTNPFVVAYSGQWAESTPRAGEAIYEAVLPDDTSDYEDVLIGDLLDIGAWGIGATPALALCIAALRARAAHVEARS